MASSHHAKHLLGVNPQQKLGSCVCVGVWERGGKKEKECEKCVLVCALTFQSMVEKNAWRLISSTPSGPAPKDTDRSGSVNPALLLFIDSSAHY